MNSITLAERCHHWNDDLSVDSDSRTVKNVALAGITSRNGYRYAKTALSEAAQLYEGKSVFLDHSTTRPSRQERSTRDLVGSICNARFENGRIRGDIRVLDTESGELFLKLVEADTPGVGMSHVVLAARSADGKTVERIADVLSVDVVVNPATTQTFRESLASGESENAAAELIEQLESAQQQCARLRGDVQELQTELAQVRRQESVLRLLSESGLSPDLVSDCFRRQLLDAELESTRRQLIADRLSLLAERDRSSPPPRSAARTSQSSSALSEQDFVQAVRRHA